MLGLQGQQTARPLQFRDERLRGWDLVGILGAGHMGHDELLGLGECAEPLGGARVGDMIEAAPQDFPVAGDAAARAGAVSRAQGRAVGATGRLQGTGVKLAPDVAHRGTGWRSFPRPPEHRDEALPAGRQEAMDLAIGGGAAGHRQQGADEQRGELVAAPLGTAWVGQLGQALLQGHEASLHGPSSEPHCTEAEN